MSITTKVNPFMNETIHCRVANLQLASLQNTALRDMLSQQGSMTVLDTSALEMKLDNFVMNHVYLSILASLKRTSS